MSRWLYMLLNGGRSPDGAQVIPEEVLIETFTPVNTLKVTEADKAYRKPLSPASFTFDNYALGWRTGFYRGRDRPCTDLYAVRLYGGSTLPVLVKK